MIQNPFSRKPNMYLVVDDYGDQFDMRGRTPFWDKVIDRAFHFIGESSFMLTHKLDSAEKPKTAPRAEWLCPYEYPPPRGIKLQVLTWGGVGTEGHWDHKLYAAWSPMPNTPKHIKHRMMLYATGRKSELGIE